MLKQLRHTIITNLWVRFHNDTSQIKLIEEGLKQKGIDKLLLDHFAIIDLPGPKTGIGQLSQIFSAIGYIVQGRDYLADKQNDFLWMTESDSKNSLAKEVLPQVVVADFRLDEMPVEIKKIIEKYSRQAQPSPLASIQKLVGRAFLNDFHAAKELNEIILHYLRGRDWPPPTKKEFCTIQEFNELLAWVLIFGRRPNHFSLSIHLLDSFSDLFAFHQFIEKEIKLTLNHEGGIIKGNKKIGIAQSSTIGDTQLLKFDDGEVEISSEFVEFVWRYPRDVISQHPILWEDYFTGFIPQHADHVIESLYLNETEARPT